MFGISRSDGEVRATYRLRIDGNRPKYGLRWGNLRKRSVKLKKSRYSIATHGATLLFLPLLLLSWCAMGREGREGDRQERDAEDPGEHFLVAKRSKNEWCFEVAGLSKFCIAIRERIRHQCRAVESHWAVTRRGKGGKEKGKNGEGSHLWSLYRRQVH